MSQHTFKVGVLVKENATEVTLVVEWPGHTITVDMPEKNWDNLFAAHHAALKELQSRNGNPQPAN